MFFFLLLTTCLLAHLSTLLPPQTKNTSTLQKNQIPLRSTTVGKVKKAVSIRDPPAAAASDPKENRFVVRKTPRKNRFESDTRFDNEPELDFADCRWTEFSDWSECSKACDVGSQTRYRRVEQKEFGGGRPCIGRSSETRLCNRHHCGSGRWINPVVLQITDAQLV